MQIVDAATKSRRTKIELAAIRDVEMLESRQKAVARKAEGTRANRARVIKAVSEFTNAARRFARMAQQAK
ncbi:hypothetical protein MON38_07225 [Hymenobacter sp. DH14]|uniref:Uncharacterized protein n=1 Tax=Hymenobacter cyanobacteriorum TaxID=2926463 RepID=A0A9X2AG41_9BACT|nr:hypothetical protein [Hymenobacter cyanobacteriorum]MCI1187208.1 hypothetical protein [Hymenobacter cyanobacteriorum]